MRKRWIVVIVLAVVLIPVISFGIRWAVAPATGALEMRESVQSGEFRFYSYNHFYDLLVSINADEQLWDSNHDILQSMEQGTPEYTKTQRILATLGANIVEQKKQYNADASKEKAVGIFRDHGLPAQINAGQHEYGNRTGGIN